MAFRRIRFNQIFWKDAKGNLSQGFAGTENHAITAAKLCMDNGAVCAGVNLEDKCIWLDTK